MKCHKKKIVKLVKRILKNRRVVRVKGIKTPMEVEAEVEVLIIVEMILLIARIKLNRNLK